MIKRYFVTGLLLWVPIGITLWVLGVIVTAMDLSLALVPERWTPRFFIGHDIPGIGALVCCSRWRFRARPPCSAASTK